MTIIHKFIIISDLNFNFMFSYFDMVCTFLQLFSLEVYNHHNNIIVIEDDIQILNNTLKN